MMRTFYLCAALAALVIASPVDAGSDPSITLSSPDVEYLIHVGGTETYNGSLNHRSIARLHTLGGDGNASFVWIHRADGEWIVRDSEFVARADGLFRPPAPLRKKTDDLARRERELDDAERVLDEEDARLDAREDMIDEAEEALDDDDSLRSDTDWTEIDRRHAEIDHARRALDERQRRLDAEQRKLDQLEEALDREMEAFEQKAESILIEMIDDAIRSGLAQRL